MILCNGIKLTGNFLKLATKFNASDVLFEISTTLKQVVVKLIKLDAQSWLC